VNAFLYDMIERTEMRRKMTLMERGTIYSGTQRNETVEDSYTEVQQSFSRQR
jgi:hypothetical protein